MPKKTTSDVTKRFKGMRKHKIIELCKSDDVELTEKELEVFLLRVYNDFYNHRVSDEVGCCERKVTDIFMSAITKLRSYFNDKENK